MRSHDIIACRFGRAIVVHVWKTRAKGRLHRVRFAVDWHWETLEPRAIEAVKTLTGGAWPVQGYFSCPDEIAQDANFDFSAGTRTEWERHRRQRDAERAHTYLIAEIEGRFLVCMPVRDSQGKWAWLPAQNWEALEAEARASLRTVIWNRAGRKVTRQQWNCPPELAARAITPHYEQRGVCDGAC